jgi:hypothetical protein
MAVKSFIVQAPSQLFASKGVACVGAPLLAALENIGLGWNFFRGAKALAYLYRALAMKRSSVFLNCDQVSKL